jgi:hypothetical protein|nr:hypothetical protein [Kofleriaceae bacterium]
MKLLRAAVTAMILTGAVAGVASADTACTFLEVSATTGDKPAIDPDLKPLEKKLKRPPFSAWNVFRVQSKHDSTLQKGKPDNVALQSGKASVMLRDHVQGRVQLEILVDDASGKRIIAAKPDLTDGEWLVLGMNANSNGHLLALACK